MEQRSVGVFVAFALLLGCLGAHRFYAGRNGSAVAMLLITVFTLGIGAVVTLPWSIIDAIRVHKLL